MNSISSQPKGNKNKGGLYEKRQFEKDRGESKNEYASNKWRKGLLYAFLKNLWYGGVEMQITFNDVRKKFDELRKYYSVQEILEMPVQIVKKEKELER